MSLKRNKESANILQLQQRLHSYETLEILKYESFNIFDSLIFKWFYYSGFQFRDMLAHAF